MKRTKEEKLVIELSVMVGKLLECYQWDHCEVDYQAVEQQIALIKEKISTLELILGARNE